MDIKELIGKTLVAVNKTDDEVSFHSADGDVFKMYHSQSCCESVIIDDVNGDLQDLIGSPITMAYEACSSDCGTMKYYEDSYTWTFYHIGTVKGIVSIRWYGSSNGYYSESVSFEKVS